MFKQTNKLYCFSPPVMLATLVIEIGLAAYTVIRYRMTTLVRLATSMLLLLAVFQFAEYNVCGRSSASALVYSRLGYIAITLLPPLALHAVYAIAKRKTTALVWLAYACGLGFAVVFGFHTSAFAGHICAGNYAIFQLIHPIGGLYFAYYYFWVIVGIGLGLYFSISSNQRTREALVLQVCGYLSFLLPTGIVNAVNPQTISGIPSVMCGFAVLYALILALGIIPSLQQPGE
ncbi:MAG: hypothetical protein JWS12_59 [Candidatus Saccharibacteria bacterium]|nr:hypothetical protein [Candidatus Saccharibacteria bacterium]